jgi:glyoxalase family protein
MTQITGLHHITLVTADARRNAAFYTGSLGMRLVKKTVNFDDPSAYHLYYADAAATAGTAVTFFEWKHAVRGSPGVGGTQHMTLAYNDAGSNSDTPRFVTDPDGTRIALHGSPHSAAYAQIASVTVLASDLARAEAFYAGVLGMHTHKPSEGEWGWSATPETPIVLRYLKANPGAARARMGAGQAHHFALSVPDDATQQVFLDRLRSAGLRVSDVLDRNYFHSIYTSDPDGHIVEIATVNPGFAVDEAPDKLGQKLMLPAWFEAHRAQIEANLTPLT